MTIPNTFTSGTPAKAAEVNANFAAVKAAVDGKAPVASPTFTGTVTAPTFVGALNGNATTATTATTAITATTATTAGTANTANDVAANVVRPSDLNSSASPATGQVPSKAAADTFTWVTPITSLNATGGLTASMNGSTATLGVQFPTVPIFTVFAPSCSGANVSSTPVLIASFGTFTKRYANTPITIAYQGNVGMTSMSSGAGVMFQLRVDGTTPTPAGGGSHLVPYSRAGPWGDGAHIEAFFAGLAAGVHSVEMYAWASGGSATGATQDAGCFENAQVLVREN